MNDKITVTDYFGGCPKCGGSDGLYNVGRANWFVCHSQSSVDGWIEHSLKLAL
jgi:hypothetical protein